MTLLLILLTTITLKILLKHEQHQVDFNFKHVTSDDVNKIITSLDARKAVGSDLIHAKSLKDAAPIVRSTMTKIFNKMLTVINSQAQKNQPSLFQSTKLWLTIIIHKGKSFNCSQANSKMCVSGTLTLIMRWKSLICYGSLAINDNFHAQYQCPQLTTICMHNINVLN
mgnify:CR=1 FL=1